MNVLLINGSPQDNGNTNSILEIFTQNIAKNKYDEQTCFTTIPLSNMAIEYCHGCRICFTKSEMLCPYKEDIVSIKSRMIEADIIIIGSPVYVEDVTGLVKNWIDRMAYNCHRPFLNGKPTYIFTTSGAMASLHAIRTIKHAMMAWGAENVNYDNYSMGNKMEIKKAEMLYGKQIEKRVNEIFHIYNSKNISTYSLLAFNVQKQFWLRKNNAKEPYDYNYWIEQGWLNKDCLYYHPVKVNIFKKYIAKLMSKLVAIIMFSK